MVEIEVVPVLEDNYSFILRDTATGLTALVDPPVVEPLMDRLAAKGGRLDLILITHHHDDHIAGVDRIKELTGAKVIGPAKDAHRIPGMDQTVVEGDGIPFGAERIAVWETPGHTTGHISLHLPDTGALFCADTIFALGCGRVIEGDMPMMWASIAKLMKLPDTTVIYCGHEYTLSNARFAASVDPANEALKARVLQVERAREAGRPTVPSTMAEEKATNPFLRPSDLTIRKGLGMESATDAEVFGELRRRKDTFRAR